MYRQPGRGDLASDLPQLGCRPALVFETSRSKPRLDFKEAYFYSGQVGMVRFERRMWVSQQAVPDVKVWVL